VIVADWLAGFRQSTLVDQLAREYRKQNKTVGIVRSTPTSPYTRRCNLGDRIRMQAHHADPGIFIRSMATRVRARRLGARDGRRRYGAGPPAGKISS